MRASRLVLPMTLLALVLATCWQAGLFGRPTTLVPGNNGGPPGKAPPDADGPVRVIAEGRLVAYPGAEVVVGTEVGGTIVRLPVTEMSLVRAGELIAELRSDDLRASLAESEARIAEAEADRILYERETRRSEQLVARGAGSQTELDSNRRHLESARARRAAAAAASEHNRALIAKTHIVAPIGGTVIARHAHPGETVVPFARLVTIADLARVRVEAEVDESDIARIAIGVSARVTAEGFAGASWPGVVEEIPVAVAGRRLRPEDPGRPADMRVLLVKLALRGRTPLKLGQRVYVEFAPNGRESSPGSTPR
jgi:multidrug efflux pump subunit AcrA (membrane-fusion protein)